MRRPDVLAACGLAVALATPGCAFDPEAITPDGCLAELTDDNRVKVSNRLSLTPTDGGVVPLADGAAQAVYVTKPGNPDKELSLKEDVLPHLAVLGVDTNEVDPLDSTTTHANYADKYDGAEWPAGAVRQAWVYKTGEDAIEGLTDEERDALSGGDLVIVIDLPEGWDEDSSADWHWIGTDECRKVTDAENGSLIHSVGSDSGLWVTPEEETE